MAKFCGDVCFGVVGGSSLEVHRMLQLALCRVDHEDFRVQAAGAGRPRHFPRNEANPQFESHDEHKQFEPPNF